MVHRRAAHYDRLYGGLLHDLLIEPEKEAVMDDIVAWLRPRV